MKEKVIGLFVIVIAVLSITAISSEYLYDKHASISVRFELIPSNSSIFFDIKYGDYPSIAGTFYGTIKPTHEIKVNGIYTYPCKGTGGHSEYIKIWNETDIIVEANWAGYRGDWHNITFNKPIILLANKTYNCTIRTGSYPQIYHAKSVKTADGWINCSSYIDVNGNRYGDWIPCIKMW